MAPTGETAHPVGINRTRAVGISLSLLAGLILWPQQPSVGSVPDAAPSIQADSGGGELLADKRTTKGRLRVRVEGELLGRRATVTLHGLRGAARGTKMRIKLTGAKAKRLPPGRYTITAAKIRNNGFLSESVRDKRKIRLRAGRTRAVVFRYFLQGSGQSDAGGQDVYSRNVDVRSRQGFIASSPDGSSIYAATEVPSISVINAADATVKGEIPTNSTPGGVAVSPDGTRLYFTESLVGQASLVTVDIATGRRVGTPVQVAGGCSTSSPCTGQIAVSPDGSRVYVPLRTGRSVAVVDPAAGVVTRRIPVESNPQTVAVSADGARLFAANSGAGTLSVVDTTSGTVIHSVRIGPGTFGVAASRDGHYAYVSSNGRLTGVDTTSGTVAFVVRTGGVGRSVALSPDGARAYVAVENADSVAVVNLQRRRSADPIMGLPGPFGVAFTPDGLNAFVSQTRSNNIGVIEAQILVPQAESVSLTGSADTGKTLTAIVGNVVSVPAPATLTYRWQRGASSNGPFGNIAGATAPNYTVTPADAGQYLRVAVTAKNLLSTGPVQTSAVVRVAELPTPRPRPTPTPTGTPPRPTASPTTSGPTSTPTRTTPTPSPTPPTATVNLRVQARAAKSKLFVRVSPVLNQRHHWRFTVQKKRKKRWQTLRKKYRTTGTAQTRTINLPRGTYRVVVPAAYGFSGATSKSVRLKR